jgi:hypothetical protein
VRYLLYLNLEKEFGRSPKRKVVAFFASFWSIGGLLSDNDADMLEEVLQNTSLGAGDELVLMINSPGGEGLAAERIVNICRHYGNGGLSVIVPKMAKSAATMICFGANDIHMAQTSELGPIDPQIQVTDKGGTKYLAAHEIIESYNELMGMANRTSGRVDPFLQQLQRFDARDIRRIKSAQALSESIAINCLKSGRFSGLSEREIKRKMKPFLNPIFTKVHGRPIYRDVAKSCGLNIVQRDVRSPFWQIVRKLYVRLNRVVSQQVSEIIESAEHSWMAPLVMPSASD